MINILIVYDIKTSSDNGEKRLQKVSKICENYGIRVQDSVFECNIDSGKLLVLKDKLLEVINEDEDSIRIYKLKSKEPDILGKINIIDSFDLGFFL